MKIIKWWVKPVWKCLKCTDNGFKSMKDYPTHLLVSFSLGHKEANLETFHKLTLMWRMIEAHCSNSPGCTKRRSLILARLLHSIHTLWFKHRQQYNYNSNQEPRESIHPLFWQYFAIIQVCATCEWNQDSWCWWWWVHESTGSLFF